MIVAETFFLRQAVDVIVLYIITPLIRRTWVNVQCWLITYWSKVILFTINNSLISSNKEL